MNFDFSDDQLAIRDAVESTGADYWLERDGRWPGDGWFGRFGFAQEYHVERSLCESVLPLLAPVTRNSCCTTSPSRRSDCRSRIDRRIPGAAEPRLATPAGSISGDRSPRAWESATCACQWQKHFRRPSLAIDGGLLGRARPSRGQAPRRQVRPGGLCASAAAWVPRACSRCADGDGIVRRPRAYASDTAF